MNTDGIIFDVDGTIWDSTASVEELWNEAIAENSDISVRVHKDQLKQLFGKTMEEIGDILFPMVDVPERRKLEAACHEKENKGLREHPGMMYEGIEEVFAELSKTYPLYIVSNCQSGYIEMVLETLKLGKYIKDYTCFGDTGKGKADNLCLIVEKHQMKNPVYIGDTSGDYEACRKAGIPMIYAAYGFGEAPDAAGRIEKPLDLLELIG